MADNRLKWLERRLSKLDGAQLNIQPEKSPEFSKMKKIMGQGLYSTLLKL